MGEGSASSEGLNGADSVAAISLLKIKLLIMLIQRFPFAPGITRRSAIGWPSFS